MTLKVRAIYFPSTTFTTVTRLPRPLAKLEQAVALVQSIGTHLEKWPEAEFKDG